MEFILVYDIARPLHAFIFSPLCCHRTFISRCYTQWLIRVRITFVTTSWCITRIHLLDVFVMIHWFFFLCVSRWQASCSLRPWWWRSVHWGWLHRLVWNDGCYNMLQIFCMVHTPRGDKSGLDSICLASFFCLWDARIQSLLPSLCLIGLDLDNISLVCFYDCNSQAWDAKCRLWLVWFLNIDTNKP